MRRGGSPDRAIDGEASQLRATGWRWAIVGLGAIMTFAVAFWFGRFNLPAWNTSHTVIEGVPHARSVLAPGRPHARRLVFAIVDGLGFDYAEKLETLAPLARDGALRPMIASYPTYTASGITAMFTGLSPRESGFRLNAASYVGPPTDDVLHAAFDGGVGVRVRSRDFAPFLMLARPPRGAELREGRLRVVADVFEAESLVDGASATPTGRDILAVHIGEVADESHAHGPRSRTAREAALHAGLLLQTLAAALDPTKDVLVAASDHGHRAGGGHGGVEEDATRAFFLAWGHDIKAGARLGPRPLRDVAPTLSLLLGVHTPSSSMGTPMIDILDEPDGEIASDLAEPFDELTRFDCAQLSNRGCDDVADMRAALDAGDPRGATDFMDALSASLDDERDRAGATEALGRLAAGILLAAAVVVAASFRAPKTPRWFMFPLVAWLPYFGILGAAGYALSLSGMRPGNDFLIDAVSGGALSALTIGIASFRHTPTPRDALWLVGVTFALSLFALTWAGASAVAPPPPLAAPLAFLTGPLVPVATVNAAIMLAVHDLRGWRRSRRVSRIGQ